MLDPGLTSISPPMTTPFRGLLYQPWGGQWLRLTDNSDPVILATCLLNACSLEDTLSLFDLNPSHKDPTCCPHPCVLPPISSSDLIPKAQFSFFQAPGWLARLSPTAHKPLYTLTLSYFVLRTLWEPSIPPTPQGIFPYHTLSRSLLSQAAVRLPSVLACTHVPSWHHLKPNLGFWMLILRNLSCDHRCELRKDHQSKLRVIPETGLPVCLCPTHDKSASSQIYPMPRPPSVGKLGLLHHMTWWIWQNPAHSRQFQMSGHSVSHNLSFTHVRWSPNTPEI